MDTLITSKETSDEMTNSESPNNVYTKFLSFCSQALSKEDPKFLELIKAKYETCDHEFRCSERMVNLLKETQGNMEKEPLRIFVHLKDLITELKAFSFAKNVKKRKKEKIQAPSCLDVSVDGIGPAEKIPKFLECSVSLEKTSLTSVLKLKTADSFDRRRDQSCLIGHGNFNSAEEISQLKQSDPYQNSLNSQALLFENGDPSCEDISDENSLKDRTTCTNSLSTDRLRNVQNCLKNSSPQKKLTIIHDIGCSQSQNIEKIVPIAMDDPSCTVKDKAKSNVYGKVELTQFDKNDLSSSKDIQVLEDSKQTSQMIDSETICEILCNTQRMETNEYEHLEKSLLTTNTLQEVVLKIADVGDSSADAQLPDTIVSLKTSENSLTSHGSVLLHAVSIGEEAPVRSLDPDDEYCADGTTLNDGVDASPKLTITSSEQQPETSAEHSTLEKDVTEDILGKLGTLDNQNADKTKEHKRANLTSVLPNCEKPETQSKFALKPGPSWKADEEEGASADEFQESKQDEKLKAKPNRRHVRKLENLLESLRNEIEKCQKRELSLEDLEDETSPYIYEDKLKKKFVAAWKKLCEITSRSVSTGRPTERTIKFSGTRYKEINRRLERFLNKKKVFPDFFDVKNIVNLTNKKYKMKLSAMMINDIAREAFVDIGEMLQTRRHQDFIATFGNRQTDTLRAGVDPYMTDPELRRKLDSNRKVARNNLDEVIAKYTRLQNERHYDDDDDDEEEDDDDKKEEDEEANDINEDDCKHTDDKDRTHSLHKGTRKTIEMDESVSLYDSDGDASEALPGLPENLTSVASGSPKKGSPEGQRISSQKTKPKYNPLERQLCENLYLAGSDGAGILNSPLPEDAHIHNFVKALGLNPSVQSSDSPNRTSQGNVIVIDESPTPTRSGRGFMLKNLGSSSDADGQFDDATPETNLGNGKMTLLKKPNIKFTARKTLPPESKPLKVYVDNEDDDVMISYEEIAKENLEDSEDQSSDAGSENNDPVLEDEDDDIMVIDSSESEVGSESSRGGSPVSIISLGSSLEDEEETFENDIDLVNKMFKIKKEVISPQKLTSDPKDEQEDPNGKLLDQFKLKSFKEFSKYGNGRESMKSTQCNSNAHLSQILDLANSSGFPGKHKEDELLRKLSRRNGTDFLDLASCEVSAAETRVKGDLNRDKSCLKIKSGEVQSTIMPDLDNDCIMIRDASEETLGEKCGQAHQDSIISDQAVHALPSDNNSKTECEISKEKAAGQESVDSILITDSVTSQEGSKEIRIKLNCASKEPAHSEDVIAGDAQRRADGAVVNSTPGYEALECTENLEVAIEVDECFIGASEMGLPLAAENDTYLLHQDKGKIFQGLLNNQTTCVGSKAKKKVDFIKKQELPGVSKGHTVRSKAFASPCTEDVSVIVIDENSQDVPIYPAENQPQLKTNMLPNKSRQNPKDTEKHYQNFLPNTTSSFKKNRYPEVVSRLDHTEAPRLNRAPGLKSVPKYSALCDSSRDQRASVKSKESGISTKGKDSNRSDQGPVIEIDCSDDEEVQSKMCAGNTTAVSDDAGGFIRNDTPNVEVHTKSKPGSQSLSGKELDSVPTIEKDSASAVEEVTSPSTGADKTKTSQPSQELDCVEIQEVGNGNAQSREVLIMSNVSSQVGENPSEENADGGQTSMQSHLDDPPKTPDCIHNLRESVLPGIDAGVESEVSTSPSGLTSGHGEQDDQQGIALTICSVVSLNEDLVVSESSPAEKTDDVDQPPAGCGLGGHVEEVMLVGTESMSSTSVEGSKRRSLADSDASKPNCAGDLSDSEDVVLVEETLERGEGDSSVNKEENLKVITCSKEREEVSLPEDTCSGEKGVQGETISKVESDLPAPSVPEAQGSFQCLEAQQDGISSKTGDQEDNALNAAENVTVSDVCTVGQTKSDEAAKTASSDTETNDQDNDEIEEDEDAFKSIFRICDKMLRNDKPTVDEKQLSSESPVSVPDSVTGDDSCKLDEHSNSLCSNVDTPLDINPADHVSVDETPVKTLNGNQGELDPGKSTSQEVNGAACSPVAASSSLTKGDRVKDGEGHESPCHTIPVDGVSTEAAASVDDDAVNETDEGETNKGDGGQKRKRSASTDDCEAEVEIIEELSSAKGKRLCARSKEDDRKLVDQLLEDMVLQTTHLSPGGSSVESVSKLTSSKTDDKTLASGSPKGSQETEGKCQNVEDEVPGLELECDIVDDGLSPSTSTVENTEVSPRNNLPVVMSGNKKKRERERAEITAKPEGGQDENSTRDQALQPVLKKPKPGINFIDEIISTIFKEIPPKGKSRQQTVSQIDAEDDVVLVEAEFEPPTVVKQKSTVRHTIGNVSFHPISSSTPKNFRSNPTYRNSPGQPISSRVRPNVSGLSPFRPTQGNSNTAFRSIPQRSSAFPPNIPLQSHRFRSHNSLQHAQSSHHILPSLKPRVPIPTVQPQPAVVLNSQFRPRNSPSFKPVGGERRVIQQARHMRNTSGGFLPHASTRVVNPRSQPTTRVVNPRSQPSTSFSPHSPGSAQRRKVTKLPPPRNIDGAQIVLDESDTDDLSGGGRGEMAHSVPRILSVTSLKADSKYVPNKEDANKQLVNSRGHKDSMKKRTGDVIVLSDSE